MKYLKHFENKNEYTIPSKFIYDQGTMDDIYNYLTVNGTYSASFTEEYPLEKLYCDDKGERLLKKIIKHYDILCSELVNNTIILTVDEDKLDNLLDEIDRIYEIWYEEEYPERLEAKKFNF